MNICFLDNIFVLPLYVCLNTKVELVNLFEWGCSCSDHIDTDAWWKKHDFVPSIDGELEHMIGQV